MPFLGRPGKDGGGITGFLQGLKSRLDWTPQESKDSELWGFSGGPVVENLACNAGDMGFNPRSGN